ncbi:hypothetical protein [Aquabacterium sp. J223]|uniref:hypothetical protein n=1 Tax=Aquabacterium sp. J223 TaxID=2898431 RepID=UPI0021AD8FC9|nr:hypothetical protein [Aquabacterium sp. J223]UUX94963.1 hypothetical protein LRS07_17180 [Aquabacterium sp. J223]
MTFANPARRLPPGLHRGLVLGLLLLLALLSWAVSASDCPTRSARAGRTLLPAEPASATAAVAAARPSWSQAASVTTATVAACAVREAPAPALPKEAATVDAPEFGPMPGLALAAGGRPSQAWPLAAGPAHPNAPPQRLLRPPALG